MVVRQIQQAIDIKNAFLAHLRPVACPAALQKTIRYVVFERLLAFFAVQKRRMVDRFFRNSIVGSIVFYHYEDAKG